MPNGGLNTIAAHTITNALKKSVRLLKLEDIGIYPALVSTHSLRSGGTTAKPMVVTHHELF